jgi:hypothetical protein
MDRRHADDTHALASVQAVVEDSARRYISRRRQQVDAFCRRHFSIQGAWCIHQKAIGHDLWRVPLNLLWAVPYWAARVAARLSRPLHWQGTRWLERLPPGFKTSVASELEWLIYTELLELPVVQANRSSERDALLETILSHEALIATLLPELSLLHQLTQSEGMRQKLQEFLSTYTSSRTAANELAGSLLNLAAGAAAFREFTPGVVSLGHAAAAALAQQLAIANFALGPTLGSLYYGLFPATASAGLVSATVGAMMAVLGVLTAFTGLVTDPVQQALGLHERRLQRLLTAIEHQLTGVDSDFRLRDAYVARIFDVVDVVRSAVRFLRS